MPKFSKLINLHSTFNMFNLKEMTEEEIVNNLKNEAETKLFYSQEIADLLKKYYNKIERHSRLSFGISFVNKELRYYPVKIYYADVRKPIEMYGLQKNESGFFYKKKIPEIGMLEGSIINQHLGGLFDFFHEYGNPITRISKILEDNNVVKVDFS